jgi:hypothetical protein
VYVNGQGASTRPLLGSTGAGLGVFGAGGGVRSAAPADNRIAGWWLNHCEHPTWAQVGLEVDGPVAGASLAALPVELVHLEVMKSDFFSLSPAGTFASNVWHESKAESNRTIIMGVVTNRAAPDPAPRVIVTQGSHTVFDGGFGSGVLGFEIEPGNVRIEVPSVDYPGGAMEMMFWIVEHEPQHVCSLARATQATCTVTST